VRVPPRAGTRLRHGLLVGAVLSSLALTACGGGGAAAPTTYRGYVLSLGGSSHAQFTVRASLSGPGIPAAVRRGESIPDVVVLLASRGGGPLASANAAVDAEVKVTFKGTVFADVRVIGSDLYATANPEALQAFDGLPGVKLAPAELGAAQLLLGDRWFTISWSAIKAAVPASAAFHPTDGDLVAVRAALDAAFRTILTTPSQRRHDGGFVASGDLAPLFNAIVPPIAALAHDQLGQIPIPGTLSFTVSGSSSSTDVVFSGSIPNNNGQDDTLTLTATVTHASTAIAVPPNATKITPALIKDFSHLSG